MAIVGGLVLVAEGVAGVVDQANPCGLAAGLGLSNAGLGPAFSKSGARVGAADAARTQSW